MDSTLKKKSSTLAELHFQATRQARAASRTEQRPTLIQMLDLQAQRNDLYERYLAEWRTLLVKYEEMYTPLYQQRAELSLVLEGFWLTALKQNGVVATYIESRDEELLKWVKDIRCTRDANSDSFTLIFDFSENPIISNPVLEKSYILATDAVLEKAAGTEILWTGEKLTERISNRRQVNRVSKKTRTVQKTVTCNSFFHFFKSVNMPGAQELAEMESSAEESIAAAIEEDFDLACEIRDEVIPNALYNYLKVSEKDPEDVKEVEEEERKKPERGDCKHM